MKELIEKIYQDLLHSPCDCQTNGDIHKLAEWLVKSGYVLPTGEGMLSNKRLYDVMVCLHYLGYEDAVKGIIFEDAQIAIKEQYTACQKEKEDAVKTETNRAVMIVESVNDLPRLRPYLNRIIKALKEGK